MVLLIIINTTFQQANTGVCSKEVLIRMKRGTAGLACCTLIYLFIAAFKSVSDIEVEPFPGVKLPVVNLGILLISSSLG